MGLLAPTGLGADVARKFGAPGSSVGLIARNQGRLDLLAMKPGRAVTGTSVALAGQAADIQLVNEVLGEEGIQVAQLIIGRKIVAGDADKDPDVLAGQLWALHTNRDTVRVQVSTD